MARIFLSHSSKDNAEARALGDWLADNGWPAKDVFLDIDPESGIAPGERWQRALNDAAGRCEAVIFLVSRNWLTSRWCLEELSLAHKLNRRLFLAAFMYLRRQPFDDGIQQIAKTQHIGG